MCGWLDVLFDDSNNAGVLTRNCTLSCDGLELHFATNHIGVSLAQIIRTNFVCSISCFFRGKQHILFNLPLEDCPFLHLNYDVSEWFLVLYHHLTWMAHAGHFLLTNLLLENMKSTCRDRGIEGRIVNVTSSGHVFSHPEGICFEKIRDPSG